MASEMSIEHRRQSICQFPPGSLKQDQTAADEDDCGGHGPEPARPPGTPTPGI